MNLIQWVSRKWHQGQEDAKVRARQRDEDIIAGRQWVRSKDVCPACKTPDGLINWYQDGMDVRGNYCDDPYLWHAAMCEPHHHVRYGNVDYLDALERIGRNIRERRQAQRKE